MAVTSRISWLDTSLEEQRTARELVALFSLADSRDELGIGQIRDAFSDTLFPGTSVLLTRARYYLFVPWCYQTEPVKRLSGQAHRAAGERNERQLIMTLKEAGLGDGAGLIGARMGAAVKTLPSTIYWASMVRFGVRTFDGEVGALTGGRPETEGATEHVTRDLVEWDPTMPSAPAGFPATVEDGFELTPHEASWLRERIITATQGSVLAHLVERDELIDTRATAAWDVVDEAGFPELAHARHFSHLIEGAPLLYNLMVGEKYESDGLTRVADPIEPYRTKLEEWHAEIRGQRENYSSWNREDMWRLVTTLNPRITFETRNFVDTWMDGVLATRGSVADDASLRALVERRERRKGKQSRLLNPKMRVHWEGWAGTGVLTYRWATVRRIVNDITEGTHDARA